MSVGCEGLQPTPSLWGYGGPLPRVPGCLWHVGHSDQPVWSLWIPGRATPAPCGAPGHQHTAAVGQAGLQPTPPPPWCPLSSRCCGPSGAAPAMNCRAEVLEVSVEGRQVEEAMLAVLHTILLHRSTGKFHYKKEGTYSIGTVGTQDVDCDFIDFAYVRVSSEELDRALRKAVGEFKDALRGSGSDGMGQISLEFYQKKKSRWPFSDECIPWELWTIKKVGEKLCEKIINIVEVMNRHEYLPKMPTQSEVDNVFDTSLKDVQPYLYKISYQITDSLGTSVTTTMRRLIKDTLAL
uniref:Autophagy-related protein 101 n=1 Tax=Taeniopygia guttata TaxID=59729 RepID=A0A674HC05_TAEGU